MILPNTFEIYLNLYLEFELLLSDLAIEYAVQPNHFIISTKFGNPLTIYLKF